MKKYDPDFKQQVEWDIPLLDHYDYVFLNNTSSNPGTASFRGINNPTAIKEIDAFNPDVILVYGWAWHSHLKIIRHYAGKKKIWFRGDSTLLDPQPKIKGFLRGLFLRWIYCNIDLAFYVGTRNKEYFRKFGVADKRLKFAPHAIDNNRFSTGRKVDAEGIRQSLGIPGDGILILFAGKMEPKKDPVSLLRAFLKMGSSDKIYLLFAGNGVLERELKHMAAGSEKNSQIFFLHFQNQQMMPALYQACQVFCLPSVGPGETWGLAVNEAMAAGTAVVVSDKVGCNVDLVKEGTNGLVFKAGDVADLTDKLTFLTDQNGRWMAFGSASQKLIQDWSFNAQVFSILEALNTI